MAEKSHHLNCKDLAAKMGRHRNFVTVMKAAGYQMEFSGTRSTLEHAEQWLREHPHFRTVEYYETHRHPGKRPGTAADTSSKPQVQHLGHGEAAEAEKSTAAIAD